MDGTKRWILAIAAFTLMGIFASWAAPVDAAPAGPLGVMSQSGADADGDGLSDDREAELGTDPALADTDGDGLLDGEEVDEFGTDPFTFDSDDDTFPDPLELEAGTDPLDPASTPLDQDANRTLDVTIFACEPGTTVPIPSSGCDPVPNADVTVELVETGSAPPQLRKTDADGFTRFTDLAAGTYLITEELPSADLVVAELQVRCGAGGESFGVEPSDNGITLELGLGGRYGCSFFNILAVRPAPEGRLTVEALICPTDYDGADYFMVCDEPAEGVLLTVSAEPVGDPVVSETNSAGIAIFTGLATRRMYNVELGVPGDFARFKVFCATEGAPEYFPLAESETNMTNLEIGDVPVGCIWFIVPEDQGAPSATVATGPTGPAGGVSGLPSTGAGSAVTAAESTLLLMVIALLGAVAITLITLRRAGRP